MTKPSQPIDPPAPPAIDLVVPLPRLVAVHTRGQGHEGSMWRRIAACLRDPIESGEWPRGARLPIELELAAHFRVNRHTVRRALAELARDGLIATSQGRGTFITAGEKARYVLNDQSPLSDTRWPGVDRLHCSLLDHQSVEAGVRLGGLLSVPSIHSLGQLALRLLADDVPLALATLWLARDRFPRFEDTLRKAESLEAAFHAVGYSDFVPERTLVSARPAEPRECGLLKIKPPAVLTLVETVGVGIDGPLEAVGAPVFVLQTALCTARVDVHLPKAQPRP